MGKGAGPEKIVREIQRRTRRRVTAEEKTDAGGFDAWGVVFGDGNVTVGLKSGSFFVRAVRGGS